ncbi:MAG: hypothetical protein ABR591_15020, partial [Candidatus Velthaea sp.]
FNPFYNFSGQTRVFSTPQEGTAAGSHVVTEISAILSSAVIQPNTEYTIEIGPPFVAIPNYTFDHTRLSRHGRASL